ncbi:MAG TPA: metallophosphoesterase [Candidatus Omnitrophota bacterium]|nr:hypothetical protein [Candidatus Omnitrophota bacterium]HRK62547.1 metallophosphoesterase [Candidatus Omnitrophota bacterium]
MKKFRRTLFFALMITAFFLAGLLVWIDLILPMHLPSPLSHVPLAVLVLALVLLAWHLLRIHVKKPSATRVFITFGLGGLCIHLLCAALTKDALIWIPGLLAHEQTICRWFGLIALMLNFLGIHGALRGPLTKRVHIPLPPQLKNLNGFKIVQISDLHIGPLIRRGYVAKAVNRIKKLKPDLIVLTGDIGDSDPAIFGNDAAPLQELSAPEGVFYIPGNHEYYWDAKAWIKVFSDLGLTPLINQGTWIANKKIWLGGITDPDAGDFIPEHRPDAEKAMGTLKTDATLQILLAHQPKSCFDAEKAGFNLMLSGHTHGGQFFPFNLIVALVNPYSKGLNQHGKMWIYVNRGTGFWGPALRLGVPAEITLIEFTA